MTADAVGYEEDCRQPLTAQRQTLHVSETRPVHVHFGVHRADEKMILVLGANLPRMRNAEEIEGAVRRPYAMFICPRGRLDGLRLYRRRGARRPRG